MSPAQAVYERTLRWFVAVIAVQLVVSYLRFFPIGQEAWWNPVYYAVSATAAIATVAFAFAAVRFLKSRHDQR